jgi:hypothetical protein
MEFRVLWGREGHAQQGVLLPEHVRNACSLYQGEPNAAGIVI